MTETIAIVGAGQAGFQVAASLRELGFAGAINLYGEESFPPYQRPPLSKTYLKEDVAPAKVFLRPETFFAEKSINLHKSARVTAIDRAARRLRLESGETAGWDRLVLATGVSNRLLTVPGSDLGGVVALRGLDDALALRPRIKASKRIVIIGGGVIGLEVSAMARGEGIEVIVVELGDRLAGRIGSTPLSDYFLQYHRGLGETVYLSTGLTRIDGDGGNVTSVTLSDGSRIETPLVLSSIGVVPNTKLAADAGLDVQDGIAVDAHMRTSDPAILAVGDCTRFKPPHGEAPRIRLESVQNAIDQGRCAAETIAGRPKGFDALPWFWSDQGSLKLQIAGLTLGHDRTIVKADPEKGAMSVFCFAAGRLIGVECINRPADFMAARRVLAQRKTISPEQVEQSDFDLRAHMA